MGVARLRRSDCSGPGITRRRHGRGSSYWWTLDGSRVTDPDVLARIDALVIPPAWRDVWICPWPNGHIQAIGTDAAGRRQYRYHDRWREQRDRQKYDRVLELGRRLPAVREAVQRDLKEEGLGRRRVLAAAIRLLDVGSFRIGGEEYAEEHETYGLATLLAHHARVVGGGVVFDYVGKSGKERLLAVQDDDVTAVIRSLKRRRGGGDELLAYRQGRRWIDVRSDDINDYLKDLAGGQFTAKDFRTWNATVLAAVRLAEIGARASSMSGRRRTVSAAVKSVSEHLGNTPAVCRGSYIDPRVIERFERGDTIAAALQQAGQSLRARDVIEAAVLDLLGEEPAHERAHPQRRSQRAPQLAVAGTTASGGSRRRAS